MCDDGDDSTMDNLHISPILIILFNIDREKEMERE